MMSISSSMSQRSMMLFFNGRVSPVWRVPAARASVPTSYVAHLRAGGRWPALGRNGAREVVGVGERVRGREETMS